MANDKYGRLYPERAVAPLRAATTVLLEMLSGERSDADRAHYVSLAQLAITDLDRLGFPPDEPLFLLRGKDILAHYAVRFYAQDAAASDAFGGRLSPEQVDVIHYLEDHADRMEAWQPRKLPD